MIKYVILQFVAGLFSMNVSAQDRESVKQFEKWTSYGRGTSQLEGHGQWLLKEDPAGSKGVGLISSSSYSDKVVLRYEVMALTPATVLVALVSASDNGETSELTLPENYDGDISQWQAASDSYFFAFHNAAHNFPPFVRRFDEGTGRVMLDMAKKNVMHVGKYYQVEVGRDGAKLWLKINGKNILKTKDPQPYSGGHLGIRIRGTATEYAACLIKNVEIISK
jgi:hypothetical protein